MKIACCTTTINIPWVLQLYKACDDTVKFFVAIDEKTSAESIDFLESFGAAIISYGTDWKTGKYLPWNSLSRRNLAFLEALKWGADIVVSIDDDNIPTATDYFWQHETIIGEPFSGLCGSSFSGWFDPGQLLLPHVKHRGIPHGAHSHAYTPIVKAKVGVSAGLVLGNSDVDATTRLERPEGINTLDVARLADAGVVVNLSATQTVFNTQNTAVIRDLVPAWFLMPEVGRMDDIYASLIVKRVARDRGWYIHFGYPLVYQERNEHDLLGDLDQEIDGYKRLNRIANILAGTELAGKSVVEDVRVLYGALVKQFPSHLLNAAMAYLDDCEQVL